ncbi:hypothetical protein [Glycomyces tenuis]|uniref:hypothetical protein n=1 Tax=Glycomyces tenuis TaxID=58116 RepID=UPI0004179FBC|nr:hypothetical protein [Glycomyces tenuis]
MSRTANHTSRTTDRTANGSEGHVMDHTERRLLFRRHATAMFRGHRTESHRIERLIYPDHYAAHQLFIQTLFVSCLFDHFGEELDRAELRRFIDRLRSERPGVSPLKTEALVRVFYGEARLYTEIPQADHWTCMWTSAQMIVGVDRSDAELAELYDQAEAVGREMVSGVFAAGGLFGFRCEEGTER